MFPEPQFFIMILQHHINYAFGPAGRWAGLFLVFAGMIILLVYRSMPGLIPVFIGAFTGLTREVTTLDFKNKRARNGWKLLNILPTGEWIDITPQMHLTIKRSNKVWTAYSRGNVPMDFREEVLVLVLLDKNKRLLMPLMHTEDLQKADILKKKWEQLLGLESQLTPANNP